MGGVIQQKIHDNNDDATVDVVAAPVIMGLQPSILIGHVAKVDLSLLSRIPGEAGGSFPIAADELNFVWNEVNTHFLDSPKTRSR